MGQLSRESAGWLSINGDAVYGTRSWSIFGEGPTQVEEGSFTDTNRVPYTTQDIRFTMRNEVLYAILLRCPEDGNVLVTSLGAKCPVGAIMGTGRIAGVSLLDGNRPLAFTETSAGLNVTLPEGYVSAYPVALCIFFA